MAKKNPPAVSCIADLQNATWHDISVPIHTRMPTWPGNSKIIHQFHKRLELAGDANVSSISLGVHTGTHVDAPYHHLEKGKPVSEINIEELVGQAMVIDMTHVSDTISVKHLESIDWQCASIYLFKTRNSSLWRSESFDPDYVHLSMEAASFLISQNASVIGIDYLTIEAFDAHPKTVHQTLLQADVLIVEGLDLSAVDPGRYFFICLPINVSGAEAAPARAVLLGP